MTVYVRLEILSQLEEGTEEHNYVYYKQSVQL